MKPELLRFEEALARYRAGDRIAIYNDQGIYGRVYSIHPPDRAITEMHGASVLREDWVVLPLKRE